MGCISQDFISILEQTLDHLGSRELEAVDLTFGFITMFEKLKGAMIIHSGRIQEAMTTCHGREMGRVPPQGCGAWAYAS